MAQVCDSLKYMTITWKVRSHGRSNDEKGEIAPVGDGIFTAPAKVGGFQISVISPP